MKQQRTLVVAIAAILASFGSSQANAQTEAAGTWELTGIDDDAVPAVVDTMDSCTEEVTSAELVLDDSGGWQLTIHERETCGADVTEDTETESGTYTVQGTTVEFNSNDADTSDEDDAEIEIDDLVSGTIDGTMMHVRVAESDAMAMFRKV